MSRTERQAPHFLLAYLPFCLAFLCLLILLVLLANRFFPASDAAVELNANEPTRLTVVIDAGHGGEDGGAVGVNGVYEKDLNLTVAQLLCDRLTERGVEVVMTRTEDLLLYDKSSDYHGQKKVQDLANRKKIAEAYENAVFISIHMNSFPDAKYSGLQVYYSSNDTRSMALAQMIQAIAKERLMPDNRRKVKPSGGSIYLLDNLQTPAVMVECGFLSNADECARLCEEDYQSALAQAISDAVLNYFSNSYQNPSLGS